MPGYNINTFSTLTSMPNEPSPSLFFFIFCKINIIDACNLLITPVPGIGCVYNANALAFSRITDDRCRTLQILNKQCLNLATRHGALLAIRKNTLTHLTKGYTMHNRSYCLTLPPYTTAPRTSNCAFGTTLDNEPRW